MGCGSSDSAKTDNDKSPEQRQMGGRGGREQNPQMREEGQNEQMGNEGGQMEGGRGPNNQMGGGRGPNNQMGGNRDNQQMGGRGGPGFSGQSGRGGKWRANNQKALKRLNFVYIKMLILKI